MARILIACEESQAVTKEMRTMGLEAYSCDIQECSGGHPEWHIKGDALEVLGQNWDMVIGFPPCTHLSSSGAAWFDKKRKNGQQKQAIDFFMRFAELDCTRVAIENPVGIMSNFYRKPDQIIQPWWFGDSASKRTCLWLKNLPKLVATNVVPAGEKVVYASGNSMPKWYVDIPKNQRAKIRSKTFPGIAKAMATQWGFLLEVSEDNERI